MVESASTSRIGFQKKDRYLRRDFYIGIKMFSIDVDRICGLLNDVTLDLLKLI